MPQPGEPDALANWLGRDPPRPELAALPPQPDQFWDGLPRGEFMMQWRYDRPCDRYLVVTRADPLLLISAELVRHVAAEPSAYARLDMSAAEPPPAAPRGAVFHVYADNGHWAYRLDRYVAPVHGWVAEWPD